MTPLQKQAAAAATRFAQQMDLTALPAEDGSYGFDFQSMGRVSIVGSDHGDMLLSLTRRLLLDGASNLARLAGLGEISPLDGQVIHAGLNRYKQPVLIARLRPEQSDPSMIEVTLAAMDARFSAIGW